MLDSSPASVHAPAPPAGAHWRGVAQSLVPFLMVGLVWEAVAHAGLFPPRLFPPLETVAAALARLTASGILPHHAAETLLRLTAGSACRSGSRWVARAGRSTFSCRW